MLEINPQDITYNNMYKLLTGVVQPRPIAWVSSVSADGIYNLAPFSFFNAVCSKPPTVLFCPGVYRQTGFPKDTLLNVRETGEFVINIVTDDLAEQMNITATELEREVDEFALAGLTPIPSVKVRVPRVAESPVHLECTLNQIITISDQPGGGFIVIGTVVYVHLDESIYIPDYKINTAQMRPVGRLAGPFYAHIHDIFEMQRHPSQLPRKEG